MRQTCAWSALALVLAACAPKPGVTSSTAKAATVSRPLEAARISTFSSDGPVVELRVSFDAGSIDDPPGQEGLTFVTATTMTETGAAGRSFEERQRLLFPMAARIEVQVEREQVVFSGRVHRDHWPSFYSLFRDMLLAPNFDASALRRISARTLSQLTQDLRGTDDESLGRELLQAMLFEGHPYGRPALGTESGLSNLTVSDLRRQRERVLCGSRVQVALSGDIDAGFVKMMAADFGGLPQARCTPRAARLPAPKRVGRRMWVIDKPEAQSVAISMGLPIDVTRSHPDHAALMLAAAYLGQHRTFAGRLMQKMRGERGLNYGDYAYAEHFVQDGWTQFPQTNVSRRTQYFSLWLRPVPVDKAQFALRMAVRELESFVQDGLSQADFVRIQEFARRYFALFAQTEQARLGYALDTRFYGLSSPYLETLCAQIEKLTRDEVNAAIKRHIAPALLQVAVVAPNADSFAQAVASDAPSPISYGSVKAPEILAEDKFIERYPVRVPREAMRVLPLPTVFR